MVVGRRLRLLFLAFFVLYIVVAYMLLRTRLPVNLALLGALTCLLNDDTCFFSDLCFPDIPFGIATLACLIAARRIGSPLPWLFASVAYALRTLLAMAPH